MNEAELEHRFRSHLRAVRSYAEAMCRSTHAAEEAVQETFVRAWKYLDTYDSRGSFEGWLLRICRNCVVDLAHRSPTVDEWSDAHDRGVAIDSSHELFDLLRCLPLPQREVIVICGLLGYDYQAASLLLDVPVGTIRSRLSRGRAAFAQLLDEANMESA